MRLYNDGHEDWVPRSDYDSLREGAAKNVSRWMEAAEIEHGRVCELEAEITRLRAAIREWSEAATDESGASGRYRRYAEASEVLLKIAKEET